MGGMSYVTSAQQQQHMQQFAPGGLQQVQSMVTPMPFPMTAQGMQQPETSMPPAGTMQPPQRASGPAPGQAPDPSMGMAHHDPGMGMAHQAAGSGAAEVGTSAQPKPAGSSKKAS